MCGIGGWSLEKAELTKEQHIILKTLLSVHNESRGQQSWGAYSPEGGTVKGLGSITKGVYKFYDKDLGAIHTRHSTHGAVTIENSHPFEIGDIVGAHNGVLSGHSELNAKYGRDFAVDSMHLIAHLSEGKPFNDIVGYGAIWYFDKKHPNRIYICRLSGGELSVAGIGKDVDCTKGIVFSSDERHLTHALEAIGVEHFLFKVEAERVYYIENGEIFRTQKKLELGVKTTSYVHHDWRDGAVDRGSLRLSSGEGKGMETEYPTFEEWLADRDVFNKETTEEVVEETTTTEAEDVSILENSVLEDETREIWECEAQMLRDMLNGRDPSMFLGEYGDVYDKIAEDMD